MAKTKLTALIHTSNNASQLGRALDSLRACDEVVVIDHGSSDDTVRVAREHGAKVVAAVNGVDKGAYIQDAGNDWILCLRPSEALGEDLEASLHEWRENEQGGDMIGYNISIREQEGHEWKFLPPEMRLANRCQINWIGDLPPQDPNAPKLQGYILRIPAEK